ncbi:MAG: MFS transporter [Nitrospinota bacterium]|nr:MFS transporter [Nitrospinota bacterium]
MNLSGSNLPADIRGLNRNVRLYPFYVAAFNAFFWMPVFFLYFTSLFSLEKVLLLEAVYYAAVVLQEVPSGHFSDRFGRRPTLLVSSAALTMAYALFLFGSGFAIFAAAQALLATGVSFNSGTDTSFHFDSLAALGREAEFAEREARATGYAFTAGAVTAFLGGAVATLGLHYAYGLSILAGLATFGIIIATVEPMTHERGAALAGGFFLQLRQCVAHLKNLRLRWLFGFAVLMTVLNHVPYEFYQTYLETLGSELDLPAKGAPLAAGGHMAVTMLLGSWFASRSVRVRDRLGLGPALLLSALLQTVIIGMMGFILHPAVTLLILLRGVPRALMTAPLNAAVIPEISQAHRATYLSIQSLAGRLSFSGVLFLLSWVPVSAAPAEWTSLSLMLQLCGAFGLAGFIALAATVSPSLRGGDA